MAIYEYQCSQCRQIHEVWQKMTDEPMKICPSCSGPVTKLISRSSFLLKGGGWYVDGYCGTKNKQANEEKAQVSKDKPAKDSGDNKKKADSA